MDSSPQNNPMGLGLKVNSLQCLRYMYISYCYWKKVFTLLPSIQVNIETWILHRDGRKGNEVTNFWPTLISKVGHCPDIFISIQFNGISVFACEASEQSCLNTHCNNWRTMYLLGVKYKISTFDRENFEMSGTNFAHIYTVDSWIVCSFVGCGVTSILLVISSFIIIS